MIIDCPHCSTSIEIDAESLRVLATIESFDCPTCKAPVPTPGAATPPPRSPVSVLRSINRNIRILGVAVILVLGGVVAFLATRDPGTTTIVDTRARDLIINNEFFTRLIQSGATTLEVLKELDALAPLGDGYVGVSSKPMNAESAANFALRAGGGVLDLAKAPVNSREETGEWLATRFPSIKGRAIWIMDEGSPVGIDAPDLMPDVDPEAEWPVFVVWPSEPSWINHGWSWVIPASYDEARPFSQWGVAPVRKGRHWGLINESGDVVLDMQFDDIGRFSEHGCAWVLLDGRRGLVNHEGKILAKPEWQEVQDRINGFIPVKDGGLWGYLDEKGDLAIPCEWNDAWRFSPEGYAVVTKNGKRGIIARDGRVVVEPEWDGAINFSKEGLGMVRRGDGWGLIDTTGRMLHPPTLQTMWKNRRWDLGFLPHSNGVIGMDGKPISGERGERFSVFATPERFRNNLAAVDTGNGTGFVNRFGEWAIKPTGLNCDDFHNGYASASKDGKWGLIDTKGRIVIEFTWDKVGEVSEDMVAVRKGRLWGFCDTAGKIVVNPLWEQARPFHHGRAAVSKGNKWGFIDTKGSLIAPPTWPEVTDFSDGFAAVRVNATEEQLARVPRYMKGNAVTTRDPDTGEMVTRTDCLFWSIIDPSGKPAFPDKLWIQPRRTPEPSFRNGVIDAFLLGEYGANRVKMDTQGRILTGAGAPRTLPGARAAHPILTGLHHKWVERGAYLDRHGRYGDSRDLVDDSGEIIVRHINPQINPYADRIPYAEPPKYGLLNLQLGTQSPLVWDEARILSPQRVRIKVDGKFGLVNERAEVMIEPEWDELSVLPVRSASLAADGENLLFGLIKRRATDDTPLISPWLRVRRGDDILFIRETGESTIPPSMPGAEYLDFYGPDHVVLIERNEDGGELRSLYEPATDTILPFPGAKRLHYNWNMARHRLIWQLVEQGGEEVWHLSNLNVRTGITMPAEMEPLGWGFIDGIALLWQQDGFAFVRTDASLLSPDKWEDARDFSEGRAAVKRDGMWAFIGTDGLPTTEFEFEETQDFNQGLAAVRQGDAWGFINPDGTWAVAPAFSHATSFTIWHGEATDDDRDPPALAVAHVRRNGSDLLIDRNGAMLVDIPEGSIGNRFNPNHRSYTNQTILLDSYSLIRKGGATRVVRRELNTDGPHHTRDQIISQTRTWRMIDRIGWMPHDEEGKPLGTETWSSPPYQASRNPDPFANGMIQTANHTRSLGLLHKDGSIALEPEYDRIIWVAPGVVAVWNKYDGGVRSADSWIFRDSHEQETRVARFEERHAWRGPESQFRHGLVLVESIPRWGYIRLNRTPAGP